MSLESANWISELDTANPDPTDKKKQGDDHLRLIKAVLKANLPNADKAFYFPKAATKSANFSVIAAEMHKTFMVTTAGGVVTATLPTLTSGDDGWECYFVKTNTGTNPLMIAPPSGTIQSGEVSGLAATRRCIPGVKTRVFWSGSAWYAERAVNLPLGSVIDNPHRSSLPVGYEYAMGQTLSSASTLYPEFYVANGNSGVVKDYQGRTGFGRTDMDGSDNGLITTAGSSLSGVTRGATGGSQNKTIATGNLPSHTHTMNFGSQAGGTHTHSLDGGGGHDHHGSTGGGGGSHHHEWDGPGTVNLEGPTSGGHFDYWAHGTTRNTSDTDINHSHGIDSEANHIHGVSNDGSHTHQVIGTTDATGSGTALSSMPPAIITDYIVVVE